MKRFTGRVLIALCLALALGAAIVEPSQAWERHRPSWGHHGWGAPHVWWGPRVYIGPPVVWVPAPYYRAPVVVESPPVYVQQPPAATGYWYYCQDPRGYYPYVSQCPGGWTAVAPTPSSP
jgi:hypothetical protein